MADDRFPDSFSRELSDVSVELARVGDLADGVGRALSHAFRGAILDGKSLKGVLGEVSRAFADIALKAALKPVGTLISGAIESLFKATDPALGGVTAFAKGGVVAAPTFFPSGAALGVAGEAGPEAILPLARGADGRLGVAGGGQSVNVTFNVTATDARSFAASEAELSAMLLRAVRRGTRASSPPWYGERQVCPCGSPSRVSLRRVAPSFTTLPATGEGGRLRLLELPMAFHPIRFPLDISLGARGGPERATDIVTLASGREERNSRWAHSRRRYNAGYGIKSRADMVAVLAFFEERRGRFHSFLWRDALDHSSNGDQPIGSGDGVRTAFQLSKTYGAAFDPYVRPITKPVAATVVTRVAGVIAASSVDPLTGIVTCAAPPAMGAAVTASFEFDVPVRFDIDRLDIELSDFDAADVPAIPLLEVRE